MTFEMVLLTIILGGGLLATIVLPFVSAGSEADSMPERPGLRGTERQNRALETLWVERLRVLRAIRDLDFDYDMNKIPESLYQSQRVQLMRLGVAILKRTDEIEAEIRVDQERAEAAIAAYRATRHTQAAKAVSKA